jgi:hypothetical protein
MKQVTIRRCPVCQNIRGLTDEVTAALKTDTDLNVRVVDGAKGEFTVEVDGRKVSGPSGEMLPTVDEVTRAVRGGVDVGA